MKTKIAGQLLSYPQSHDYHCLRRGMSLAVFVAVEFAECSVYDLLHRENMQISVACEASKGRQTLHARKSAFLMLQV